MVHNENNKRSMRTEIIEILQKKDPKEYAKELVERFIPLFQLHIGEEQVVLAKQCALICVDMETKAKLELIENISKYLPIDIYTQAVIFAEGVSVKIKQEIYEL